MALKRTKSLILVLEDIEQEAKKNVFECFVTFPSEKNMVNFLSVPKDQQPRRIRRASDPAPFAYQEFGAYFMGCSRVAMGIFTK